MQVVVDPPRLDRAPRTLDRKLLVNVNALVERLAVECTMKRFSVGFPGRIAYTICSFEPCLERYIVPVSLEPAGRAVEDSERQTSPAPKRPRIGAQANPLGPHLTGPTRRGRREPT